MRSNRNSNIARRITDQSHGTVLDVLGPTLEFLTSTDGDDGFSVMKGVIPPGVTVPLHSHDDVETFFVIAGVQQVLTESANGLEWNEVHGGDFVHVESGAPHAWRNHSGEPVIDLIVTTRRLGRFFQEVGKPITGAAQPPTPADLARLVAVSAKYGHWLATPQENAAVGIELPSLVGV